MEWRDTDEYTIMHMTGYAKNIYNKRTFSDAIKYDEYIDIPTLLYMANYYATTWGMNDDIREIIEYLWELI